MTADYFTTAKCSQAKPSRRKLPATSLCLKRRLLYGRPRRESAGKELDASRWLSGDPSLGEYLPSAPINDEVKKRNQNLPGMRGVFNLVNLRKGGHGRTGAKIL